MVRSRTGGRCSYADHAHRWRREPEKVGYPQILELSTNFGRCSGETSSAAAPLVPMNDVILTRDLLQLGFDPAELRAKVANGDLTRVRRGAFVRDPLADDARRAAKHRIQILATYPQLGSNSVISHGSAAVLHGLPVWPGAISHVHLTHDRNYGGQQRHLVRVHGTPLDEADVVLLEGIAVTSISRTVADLGRSLPFDQSVAAGDRALQLGMTETELTATLRGMRRWPGVKSARRMARFLDPRSESAGESASRVHMHLDGLPRPDLQRVIYDADGLSVGRVDFVWDEHRTVGEFDGQGKYNELRPKGISKGDVVDDEKQREDRIRDAGWAVARWGWSDLYRPGVIRGRLLRAFDRAGYPLLTPNAAVVRTS